MMLFARNKRRGNLFLRIDGGELFTIVGKNTSLQTQSKEIASRIQQSIMLLLPTSPYTEARNDEVWCQRRTLRHYYLFLYRKMSVVLLLLLCLTLYCFVVTIL